MCVLTDGRVSRDSNYISDVIDTEDAEKKQTLEDARLV